MFCASIILAYMLSRLIYSHKFARPTLHEETCCIEFTLSNDYAATQPLRSFTSPQSVVRLALAITPRTILSMIHKVKTIILVRLTKFNLSGTKDREMQLRAQYI